MRSMLGDNEVLRRVWGGPLLTLLERLNGAEGKTWEEALNRFNRKEPCWVKNESTNQFSPTESLPILHLLSKPDEIILPETDGKRTLAEASDVFTRYLDPNFRELNTGITGERSGKLPVSIYEMRQDANFQEMFTSLSGDLDKLVLPQDKIIAFCENHRDQLRADGYATFFLFKVKEKFFVAYVRLGGRGGLWAFVFRFGGDGVWGGGGRRRLVVPQLKP